MLQHPGRAGFWMVLAVLCVTAAVSCRGQEPAATPTPRPPQDPEGEPLPKGAISRFGSMRLRHGDSIVHLAMSPDGKTLATVTPGRPAAAKIWDVTDGKERFHIPFAKGGPQCAAFLPDNKTLALGTWSAGTVLIDLATHQEIRKIDTPPETEIVALSPEGKTLAAWTLDWQRQNPGPTGGKNVVCLYDVQTGKLKHRIERAHDMAVVGNIHRQNSSDFTSIKFLAFTGDGTSIATGTWDKTITLYDVVTGEKVREFGGVKQPAYAFAISADGKVLAAACTDGTIRGIDIKTGGQAFQLKPDVRVHHLTFSPDGKSLAMAGRIVEGQRSIEGDGIWDVATGKRLHSLPTLATRLDYTPDGKTLLVSDGGGAVRLFDPETGKELRPAAGHRGLVLSVAFSPDGKTLVSEGDDRSIRWWDLKTGKQTSHSEGYCISLTSHLAFSADGELLASRTDDKTIALRDAQTGKIIRELSGHPGFIYPVAISPDRKTVISAERDGPAIVWNAETGEVIRRLEHPFPQHGGECVALSGDGALLAVAKQSRVAPFAGPHEYVILDTAAGKERLRSTITNTTSPAVIVFSPDKKSLIVGTFGGIVCVLDLGTGKERLRFQGDDFAVQCLAVSPNGKLIAVTGSKWENNRIRIFDAQTGKRLREYPAHGYQLYALAFSPDSTLLASGGADSNILLWDVGEAAD
ncbi:hypothetical protein AYO44_09105 [Planctomycetaceae bacterium SCGC AG-212-F19]|nr:hypothetical protein AYO44_09105 [Planctomycetaceae bacterium SCGC AG-212-F19]